MLEWPGGEQLTSQRIVLLQELQINNLQDDDDPLVGKHKRLVVLDSDVDQDLLQLRGPGFDELAHQWKGVVVVGVVSEVGGDLLEELCVDPERSVVLDEHAHVEVETAIEFTIAEQHSCKVDVSVVVLFYELVNLVKVQVDGWVVHLQI